MFLPELSHVADRSSVGQLNGNPVGAFCSYSVVLYSESWATDGAIVPDAVSCTSQEKHECSYFHGWHAPQSPTGLSATCE